MFTTRFTTPRIVLPDEPVTPHFRLSEFARADDPWPVHDPVGYERLMRLAAILEQCRARAGAPIRVLSGWRSPERNARTPGAAKDSKHMYCMAVDFRVMRPAAGGETAATRSNGATLDVHDWIAANHEALGVHGLGIYTPSAAQPRMRIHADIRPGPGLARWEKRA